MLGRSGEYRYTADGQHSRREVIFFMAFMIGLMLIAGIMISLFPMYYLF